MLRIDTHHHVIPPDYRKALQKAGLGEAGGRAVPDWSPEASLQAMAELDVGTAILSVSTPGTAFLPNPTDAAALARDVNDYAAALAAAQPDRFGFFATVPMPHIDIAVAETVRALDELNAVGVVLLANNAGTYLGEDGQDALFAALNDRSAVVFIHPAELPGPTVPGVPPFATDFLLDTTRAAYLLVRNGIRARYPKIRFIMSHAGGFVPYAGTGWPWPSPPTPAAAGLMSLTTSPVSTSTPRCLPAQPRCPPYWRSPNRVTSPSDPIFRSPPLPPESYSRPGWRPIRRSTPRPVAPSSTPTPWRCSPGSVQRRNLFRSQPLNDSATPSADPSFVASPA
jgi:predicted TIM-barrel fold metal-dependent hydrolase